VAAKPAPAKNAVSCDATRLFYFLIQTRFNSRQKVRFAYLKTPVLEREAFNGCYLEIPKKQPDKPNLETSQIRRNNL
jgi:hypothetical protein